MNDQVVSIDSGSESERIKRLAKNYGFPFVLDISEIHQTTLNSKERLLASAKRQNMAILESGNLYFSDPENQAIMNIKTLAERNGVSVKLVLAPQVVIDSLYELQNDGENDITEKDDFEDSQAMRKLEELLLLGIQKYGKPSDIHLNLRDNGLIIYYRVQGKLRYETTINRKLGEAIARVTFVVKCNGKFNLKKIESGSFDIDFNDTICRFRANYQPVFNGGDVVIRYLSTGLDDKVEELYQLGWGRLHEKIITRELRRTGGIILVSGATGSGKTTTLASMMDLLPDDIKKYSMEEPVEKIVKALSQIDVSQYIGEGLSNSDVFELVMENLLRQDPDAIMIGEVRNLRVAEVAMSLALSGHLIMGTIHTNRALSTLTRLNDIGIPWQRLCDPNLLNLIMHQKLVRLLCDHCKVPINKISDQHPYVEKAKFQESKLDVDEFLLEKKNIWKTHSIPSELFVHNPDGCEHCANGFKDRTVIAEMIQLHRKEREFIREGDILGLEDHLIANGWEDIFSHALHLIRLGLVDPYDVDNILGGFTDNGKHSLFNYDQLQKELKLQFENNMIHANRVI